VTDLEYTLVRIQDAEKAEGLRVASEMTVTPQQADVWYALKKYDAARAQTLADDLSRSVPHIHVILRSLLAMGLVAKTASKRRSNAYLWEVLGECVTVRYRWCREQRERNAKVRRAWRLGVYVDDICATHGVTRSRVYQIADTPRAPVMRQTEK
jgi:hypothetical protein